MADKCIGKLTLDISDVEKKVGDINKALATIGSNANVKINIAKEVKDQIDKIYKELENKVNQITSTADKAIKSIEQIGTAKGVSAENNKNLREATKLWNEYYQVLAQAERFKQSGNTNRANQLQAEAIEIRKLAQALASEEDAYNKTTKARRNYENAKSTSSYKQEQEALNNLIGL
jgi:hypothetical protein